MKTQIANQLDQLYWTNTSEELDWNHIDEIFTNPYDVITSVDYFLTNLRQEHLVPGEVYYKLSGIAYWAREKNFLTKTQRRYVAIAIASYWDDLDDSAKINILLS